MEIILVRHGQPDWEPGGLAVDNPELTPLGHAQARCVARALADEHFDAIYVSPLLRAVQTAEPLLKERGESLRTFPWLREMGMPVLEGQTTEQIREYFAQVHSRKVEDWWEGMPGGERFQHFYERVSAGAEAILSDAHGVEIHEEQPHRLWRLSDPSARILIVAHEGTNAALITHLLGLEPVPWLHLHFSSAWCGISRLHSIRLGDHHLWSLEFFNRVDHLSEQETPSGGRTAVLESLPPKTP